MVYRRQIPARVGLDLTKTLLKLHKNSKIIYAVNSIDVNNHMTDTNENQQATLSITDIANVKQIIEVATNRGAFRADELTQIGTIYDRITSWLVAVTEPTDDEAEESTEGETDA